MTNFICSIVPPHILQDIVGGGDEEASSHAQATLDVQQLLHEQRKILLEHLSTGPDTARYDPLQPVPENVWQNLFDAEGVHQYVTQYAEEALAASRQVRALNANEDAGKDVDKVLPGEAASTTTPLVSTSPTFIQIIYDMESQMPANRTKDIAELLPGKLIHGEGQALPTDTAALEVYQNTIKVLQFFSEIFQYNSLNGQNMPIVSSIHFQKNLGNAYWIGASPNKTYNQMVYGDGGSLLTNFTNCIEVIGHEMTHAITQFNSGLLYDHESGALNEHISDVFGIMIKQWSEKTKARDADWLIGEGCFMPDHKGVALRNMKSPGTAYDKLPALDGKDPQPADYDAVIRYTRDWRWASKLNDDHGGCHIFSGVPNRAFVLACIAFDGYSWEKAGKIWWITVTTKRIEPNCTFIQFADATIAVAHELFGDAAATIVRDAWNEVKVVKPPSK